MFDVLQRIWEGLLARTEGPMHLRFFIQPAMSLFFAIRAGVHDAKTGETPQIKRFVTAEGSKRKMMARELWKHVGGVFIIGTILDIIYQLIVIYGLKTAARFYPLESLIVAFVLAMVPYIIFRGPVNRLAILFIKKKTSG